ncbi:hypothetical protein CAPTEDRAFT_105308 [Capitella teleta]|uniref:F-box domain-containing protein n=1 Tax=Capitella teleta TaxID=283909 RepID=R7TFU1_CAPTE|nr:hypothetical protein CAPTEDRAFT_105308 [Capitella teleta]|eukprot:ELT92604.1 hypothetical protein CAPTEDRAFT_105308 [Capitella teleta]
MDNSKGAPEADVTDLYCDFLDDFPSEILFHICSFLDAKTIWRTLSRVSQGLHDLLSSDRFWKIRISKRWPQKYPAIPVNQKEFDWKSACEAREEQSRLWSSDAEAMENVIYREGIFAPVDSVHLMKGNDMLAAGSRDRYINVIRLSDLKADDPSSEKNCSLLSSDKTHKGWIWCMKSIDNTLVTGSWDSSVAMTDMGAGGAVMRRVKCKSAVLCLHCDHDVSFMGTYNKSVIQFDPRTAETISNKSYHSGPVLSMIGSENYLITGSEDSTIVIFDRKADEVLHKYKLPASYPVAMGIDREELWVGDHEGNLHLFDVSDGHIEYVQVCISCFILLKCTVRPR